MSRFADTLQQISDRLTLPQPARGRVLLEIAADLEDLYAAYRERGLEERGARARAVDQVDLDGESLADLARVHSGPVRRLIDRMSAATVRRWERGLLVLIFVVVFHTSGWISSGDRIFRDAGFFAWPVLLLAVAALVLALGKFYQLYLKQDHDPRRLQSGLGALLAAAVWLVGLGFAGSWFEALRLADAATMENVQVMVIMLRWVLQTTALLQLSLGLALLVAMAWFGLAVKAGRIEQHEAALLLRNS